MYVEIIVQSWLRGLIEQEFEQTSYRFYSYFETLITEVHSCSGSPATGGKHVEIRHTPQQCRSLELKHSEHEAYQGDVAIWFKSLLSLDRKPDTNLKCWQNEEGISLCNGT